MKSHNYSNLKIETSTKMFKSAQRLLSKTYCTILNYYSSSAPPQKWDLLTAVCLERRPVIAPAPNDIEKAFQKLLSDVELERSHKSDHEVRHESDVKQAELLKKGDADLDVNLKQTAQDFADVSTDEFNKFKFASRTTESDETNDIKSLQRKLDKHLVLLIKQNIANKPFFLLPQGVREDGETLRQTAERVLLETCGKDVKAQILSNAPSGLYKYKYPADVRKNNGSVGAKVFIYFARHKSGQLPDKGAEHKWLDRSELKNELPATYHNSIAQFLIDES